MRASTELPHDPALPALEAIRAAGLAGAIPALGLGDAPAELVLRSYAPGSRATFEARVGERHVAVKAYAEDPVPEAELYQALAAAGLTGGSGASVPPLLAWERELRVLVFGWLEGPTALELIKAGQGARAGELAARWLWRAASLPVRVGPPCGAGRTLYQVGQAVAALDAADPALGTAAKAVAQMLTRALPIEGAPRLVHGTLYARHIYDLSDGPGVIDWHRFGQGPVELDAGVFLATVSRLGLRHQPSAGEAARAEEEFLAATRGLLDERTLGWYRAAALVYVALRVLKRDAAVEARALLGEAMVRAQAVTGVERRARFSVTRSALELVLAALSTRPASPEELEQIRTLLDEARG